MTGHTLFLFIRFRLYKMSRDTFLFASNGAVPDITTVTTGFIFLNFLLAFRMKIRYRWLEDKEGIAER